MDYKYPHWYQEQGKMFPCCEEGPEPEMMCCEEEMPYKIHPYPATSFKDRIMCLLGDEVIFSVDARICGRESFCGTLCYVGCDFVIVNVCIHRKAVSMHIPMSAIRFIAPFKSRRHAF